MLLFTLAERDRVGDGRADYSSKHKRHGVNVWVVTDPAGEILWLSPALPGRTRDLTAARHPQDPPDLRAPGRADPRRQSYSGAGDRGTNAKRRPPSAARQAPPAKRRPPGGELTPTERTVNRALTVARAPVERGMARLKSWQAFRRSHVSPNRMSIITKAVLTLEKQR
ncbi:transposase family protein [Streptomyces sp. NPDC051014]|uniref:transposase family protein n=1 Tax=Streptomyces sp. NPDC051014 TaxID=3155751 RepID=UPI0033E09D98